MIGRILLLVAAISSAGSAYGGCLLDLTEEEREAIVTAEGGCKEIASNIVWSMRGPTVSYQDAADYCSASGWELPSIDDIRRVVDLGVAKQLNIGRLEGMFFWAKELGQNENYAYITTFIDPTDYRAERITEVAETVCVRRGTRPEESCVFEDEESEFESGYGGCWLKDSDIVYSVVQERTDIYTAQRICQRANWGGRRGSWRLARPLELEHLVGNEPAERQIKGFDLDIPLWVDMEISTEWQFTPQHASVNSFLFYLARQEHYYYTVNMNSGRRASTYMSRFEQYASRNRTGSRLDDLSLEHYRLGHLNSGGQRRMDLSSTSARFICVSSATH